MGDRGATDMRQLQDREDMAQLAQMQSARERWLSTSRTINHRTVAGSTRQQGAGRRANRNKSGRR